MKCKQPYLCLLWYLTQSVIPQNNFAHNTRSLVLRMDIHVDWRPGTCIYSDSSIYTTNVIFLFQYMYQIFSCEEPWTDVAKNYTVRLEFLQRLISLFLERWSISVSSQWSKWPTPANPFGVLNNTLRLIQSLLQIKETTIFNYAHHMNVCVSVFKSYVYGSKWWCSYLTFSLCWRKCKLLGVNQPLQWILLTMSVGYYDFILRNKNAFQ